MTIRRKLHISFFLIISIIVFIISVFFYTIYNLNQIHSSQNNRYDQILRVEKLKEHHNSFSWIVLDIITDYEKIGVVKERLNKADSLFKNLLEQKMETLNNSESIKEKENLLLIYSSFEDIKKLIKNELFTLVVAQEKSFEDFTKKYEEISDITDKRLIQEISFLKEQLKETEQNRDSFIGTIKIELVILFFIALLISFIILSKIIQEIKAMLCKLNDGVSQLFNDDKNTIKVDIGEENELTEITKNLNSYLEKQSEIIHSREELLRNISHELKTPISKGKFLLENLKRKSDACEIDSINNVFIDIEELTSKLLEREKLNFATLNISKFKVSTLILESLSKLSIDDESQVILEIEDDFDIKADKYYLTLACKNLIDNAMKYADVYPIKIEAKNNGLFVKNVAKELSNDLIYYTQPFTREVNQQIGHGLGLNIVNKVVKMHSIQLGYSYQNPHNIFSITFKQII